MAVELAAEEGGVGRLAALEVQLGVGGAVDADEAAAAALDPGDDRGPSLPIDGQGAGGGKDQDVEIGEATGGDAYSAVDENDLQTVLFDALRQRG